MGKEIHHEMAIPPGFVQNRFLFQGVGLAREPDLQGCATDAGQNEASIELKDLKHGFLKLNQNLNLLLSFT